jgi:CO dehydrogenase maturation factor
VKIAISGKGGVGKTTVAAGLARCLRDLGHDVVAVDADPDANLAGTLGYRGPEITPLARLRALVEERVGGGDAWGGFLRHNPRVDDIPEQLGVRVDGIRLLVMGTIERGRRGCACPENVLLREVLRHLIVEARQAVVVDMEAGIEHLGRGTAEGVEEMLVVVEPGWASVQTAARVARLAADLGIRHIRALGNKLATEEERRFLGESLQGLELLGALPLDRALEQDARAGTWSPGRPFGMEMMRIARLLGGPV